MTTDANANHDESTDGTHQFDTNIAFARDGPTPALQVVCLGSGGGPNEDNVTGFLVRSMESGWSKGSILAVDAGSHLAAITRILANSFPLYSKAVDKSSKIATSPGVEDYSRLSIVLKEGPFAGVKFHNESARANALQLLHTYISCYLITHPHLDHISGFAINTAAFHGSSKPKTLAALPSTVDAVRRHIFNDVIWPNLSDEDGGVGFVTFQRLKEGGDPMIGEGDARGYIEVCDGIGVKAFSVSHGVCTKGPPMHQHRGSISNGADLAATLNGNQEPKSARSMSTADYTSTPGTPVGGGAHRNSVFSAMQQAQPHGPCVVDSTAYFLRDEETAREILMFGDVEPDSVSISPRNEQIWSEAAPKIARGLLRAIFIECSYSDAVSDETLFGHLCPRHLIAELQTLASKVHYQKNESVNDVGRKRKQSGVNGLDSPRTLPEDNRKRSRSQTARSNNFDRRSSGQEFDSASRMSYDGEGLSPRAMVARNVSAVPNHPLPVQAYRSQRLSVSYLTWEDPPLAGVSVVIIHVKDTFRDGPPASETILAQLQEHEKLLRSQGRALGCEFIVSKSGESYMF